jgi:hypothetical protein
MWLGFRAAYLIALFTRAVLRFLTEKVGDRGHSLPDDLEDDEAAGQHDSGSQKPYGKLMVRGAERQGKKDHRREDQGAPAGNGGVSLQEAK